MTDTDDKAARLAADRAVLDAIGEPLDIVLHLRSRGFAIASSSVVTNWRARGISRKARPAVAALAREFRIALPEGFEG